MTLVPTSVAGAAGTVPRFGHVFLIVGENTSFEQVTPAHAPFLTGTVKPQGAWLTNNHSFVKSSSLGQYIAMPDIGTVALVRIVAQSVGQCRGERDDLRRTRGGGKPSAPPRSSGPPP